MQVVLTILAKIGMSLVTEAVAKKLIILGLEQISKSTDNNVDDELVAVVREALGG